MTHLARMFVIAWLVFLFSGTTLKPYLGKLFGALIVFGGAIMWHAFQEISFYAFAIGSSLAPPWIANYAPQSMAYEVLLDLFAVIWAFSVSLMLDTPCNWMFEKAHKEASAEYTIGGVTKMMTEGEAREAIRVEQAGMRAQEGRKKKIVLRTGLMRAGGDVFLSVFAFALFVAVIVPLSQIGITYWLAGVSTAFRVDVLIWCLLWMLVTAAYWAFAYFYLYKFGFGRNLQKILADYFQTNILYTLASFDLLLAFCFAFSCHSFMGGLEFLQPLYGFGAALVPPIVFAIVNRWFRDRGLKKGKTVTELLKVLRKEPGYEAVKTTD